MSAAIPFATLPSGPLVLASASATRRRLLERAGFDVICLSASIDEHAIRGAAAAEDMPAGETAVIIAEMKGQAVCQSQELVPGQLLLAADQILELDGDMLGSRQVVTRRPISWQEWPGANTGC